jgi:hypothetical protein
LPCYAVASVAVLLLLLMLLLLMLLLLMLLPLLQLDCCLAHGAGPGGCNTGAGDEKGTGGGQLLLCCVLVTGMARQSYDLLALV